MKQIKHYTTYGFLLALTMFLIGCGTGGGDVSSSSSNFPAGGSSNTSTGGSSNSGSGLAGSSGSGSAGSGSAGAVPFSNPDNKVADTNSSLSTPVIGESFTLTQTTHVTVRFVSNYNAQASLITQDQISSFQNNQAFNGYASFNNQGGRNEVNLGAGTYYIAMRSSSSNNNGHMEVDIDPGVVNGYTQAGTFMNLAQSLAAGNYVYQPFTVSAANVYLSESCNVGNCNVWLIPDSQLAAFKAGQSFNYYTTFSGNDQPDEPYGVISDPSGTYLPPGNYDIVWDNRSSVPSFVVGYGEVWTSNTRGAAARKSGHLITLKTHPADGQSRIGRQASLAAPLVPAAGVPQLVPALTR